MDRLAALEIFVKVIELGSFTDAAAAMSISKSHCSKQIRGLEDRLQVRLVNRTTRQISPTGEGRAFYERCLRILEDINDAEQSIGQTRKRPTGTLRLGAPLAFGQRYLGDAIAVFMTKYPQLTVDLRLSDRRVDLIEEGHDMALRIGALADSSLIARKLAPIQVLLCASPGYLATATATAPAQPRDLVEHSCVTYHYQATGSSWLLRHEDGREETVRVSGRFRADNGDVMVAAAVAGLGLVYVPDFFVFERIQRGELTLVMPQWCHTHSALWALYPHTRHLSAKVRLFIDFLVEYFSPAPWTCLPQKPTES